MSGGFGSFVAWYVALAVIGIAGVPIAGALLPTLPDRGLSLARPLGLLLTAWLWWMGGVLGVLPNSPAGAGVSILLLIALAGWIVSRDGSRVIETISAHRRLIVGYELLLLISFAAWTLYKAFIPNIETAGGEKYMEMTFISGILESPRFPPSDPWMSGFSISYYYFGYVISALLIQLAGVDRFIAFNLVVPMTLGLSLVAAFGLGWNLVALDRGASQRARIGGGALGATVLALVGNLSGALEVVYRAGWIPRRVAIWLDVRNLTAGANTCGYDDATYASVADAASHGVPIGLLDYLPDRFMWWWRGSRIIHDDCTEIIHEFPFFSFMLADVHPHVMAIPYVLLVVGIGLALLLGASKTYDGPRLWGPQWLAIALSVGALAFLNTWDLPTYAFLIVMAFTIHSFQDPPEDLGNRTANGSLAAVAAVAASLWWTGRAVSGDAGPVLGGLLQTWSPGVRLAAFVLGAALLVWGGYTLWRRAYSDREPAVLAIVDSARFALWLAALSYLLYTPFYTEFASQANGFGMAQHSSRPAQWLIHLGVPVFLATSLVVAGAARTGRGRWIGLWLAIIAVAIAAPFFPPLAPSVPLAAVAVLSVAVAAPWFLRAHVAPLTAAWLGISGPLLVLLMFVRSRAAWDAAAGDWGTWTAHTPAAIGLLLAAAVAVALELWSGQFLTGPKVEAASELQSESSMATSAASTFALLCVAIALLLVIGTEFVFVRDLFNNRMNSIFKLSFQAWILFSIGGAYSLYAVSKASSRTVRSVWSGALVVLLVASGVYSVGAILSRTEYLRWYVLTTEGGAAWRSTLSLDGLGWWRSMYPEDLDAAAWLRANGGRQPTILEATGDSYSHVGRIALATGFPTVLGPHGHEGQWRGTREEIDPRLADVNAFYTTMTEAEMEQMLDRYDIDFVILGGLERSLFNPPPIIVRQMENLLEPVYVLDTTRIYARRQPGNGDS